ncbi:MAG: hypothetical protein CMM87_01840 [Rickettsiales bacterium]|nr:hypothetical protein [Rickettsiales bacterium]|tara:strand:- start:2068 stop:3378 length:1311 start_codon:yes stop_codon:yes gene_type:complete
MTTNVIDRSKDSKNALKPIVVAVISNLIEYYDYAIYGFYAAVLARSFFPADDPIVGLVQSWGVFFIGSLAKPLGAIVFGRIGDALGRRQSLRWNLGGVGIATILIALLPTYQSIGVWAPISLIFLRFFQGFFYGGEVSGIRIYVLEHVGDRRPCFANSLSSLSSSLGVAMAGWMAASSLTLMGLPSWRLAFMIGGISALALCLMRAVMPETASFTRAINAKKQVENRVKKATFRSKTSTFESLSGHFRVFLAIILLSACVSGSYYFVILHGPTLWSKLSHMISYQEAKNLTTNNLWFYTLFLPMAGWIADQFGALKTFVFALVGALAVTLILLSMPLRTALISYHGLTLVLFFMAFLNVSTYVMIMNRLPVLIRYRLIALAHALGSSFLASSVPVVATKLWQIEPSKTYQLIYLLGLFATGIIAVLLIKPLKKTAL